MEGRLGQTTKVSPAGFLQNVTFDIARTGTGIGQMLELGGGALLGNKTKQKQVKEVVKNLPSSVVSSVKSFASHPLQSIYENPVTAATAVIAPMASNKLSAAKVSAFEKYYPKPSPSRLTLTQMANDGAVPKTPGGLVGSSSRPAHQALIEQALNSGDVPKAQAIVDALPKGNPYKASMQSVINEFAPKAVSLKEPTISQLGNLMAERETVASQLKVLQSKFLEAPGNAMAISNRAYQTQLANLTQKIKVLDEVIKFTPSPIPGPVNTLNAGVTPLKDIVNSKVGSRF